MTRNTKFNLRLFTTDKAAYIEKASKECAEHGITHDAGLSMIIRILLKRWFSGKTKITKSELENESNA